jgi:hypothetical protein
MKTKKILFLVIFGSMLIPNACFGMQQPTTWSQRAKGAAPTIAALAGLAALYTYYMSRPSNKKPTLKKKIQEPSFEDVSGLIGFKNSRFDYDQLTDALKKIQEDTSISPSTKKNFTNMVADRALSYKVYEITGIASLLNLYGNQQGLNSNQSIDRQLLKQVIDTPEPKRNLWRAVLQRFEDEYLHSVR